MKYKTKTTLRAAVALCALCLLATGCGTFENLLSEQHEPPPGGWEPPTGDGTSKNPDVSTIQIGDEVHVRVFFGSVQQSEMVGIIDENGNIPLLHLGDFKLQYLTTSEAQDKIKEAYIQKKILNDPIINVIRINKNPNLVVVYISGQINRKGPVPFHEGMTLMDAIYTAGDVNQFAGNRAKLIRRTGAIETFKISRIRTDKAYDPLLRPNDSIIINESWW